MAKTILGIDEAGRGPCIGSLFLVGVMCEEEKLPRLKEIGAIDSKLLPHKKRILLAEKIKKIAKEIKAITLSPEEIDSAVEGNDGLNLNWLEAEKTAEIINSLKPDKAIIDCPSNNIKAYTNYLKNRLTHKSVELVLTHKAERFEIVAAASIIAKVLREEEVAKIEKLVKQSIGSGYPSNPICQKFLKENHENYPEIIRKSWQSYKNIIKEESQKSLGEF
ncbi:MAG TPA: ribonuclease HII [Candidatus Nanoarchaeia archaeon]|nr:ribonuclease HII [Candidatus Nanoarchaeia archaeon]